MAKTGFLLILGTAMVAAQSAAPTPSRPAFVGADNVMSILVLVSVFLGLVYAAFNAWKVSQTYVRMPGVQRNERLLEDAPVNDVVDVDRKIGEIMSLIQRGAEAFLMKEFAYMGVFVVVFSVILFVVLGAVQRLQPDGTYLADWGAAGFTVIAFLIGSITSVLSGYLGMKIAVYANARTSIEARKGFGPAFNTAFRAGAVMGFSLVSMGLVMLYVVICLFKLKWDTTFAEPCASDECFAEARFQAQTMFEAIAGYGLGGSSIALFGRVGGGIYTKAADVGADLVGKVENALNEDDPRNPAVIADNVGDNVGDIAGMGSDLFGSFAESSCAAMVIASQSPYLFNDWNSMLLPLAVTSAGIFVCFLTSFVVYLRPVNTEANIETALKTQIIVSTVLMTPVAYVLCLTLLPEVFAVSLVEGVHNYHIFYCIVCGLWSGLIIGLMTEYYTSSTYMPVREVAEACKTGAATNIIYGLALGYKSVIVPTFCLAATVYVSYSLAGMYGIAMAALGILSTLATGLTIDAYGPICDNAGGIAEMSGMEEEIRDRTDALDAAGNTTAAIGKGFAIGSAALVSLALFGAFVTTCWPESDGVADVNILKPLVFSGLLIGAMLPYWFSAMTMKSVGKAALEMVNEVRRQVREQPGILTGDVDPDYESCIAISTDASLREMIPPGFLVMLSPLLMGFLLGREALAGLLVGALVSGVQMAISSSNTGGAWDNAKKYIEAKQLGEEFGKGSDVHAASVIGDTVGDPLKDTSGPALNILIKLMAIISVVFAPAIKSVIANDCNGQGQGLIIQLFQSCN